MEYFKDNQPLFSGLEDGVRVEVVAFLKKLK
jgi:hypothetical protein